MTYEKKHSLLTYLIALVWFINGLICKVLNLVPRHTLIVSKILGLEQPRTLTILIGLAETAMALWIVIQFQPKINAIAQMIIIATMNVLEFILVPDLLLWGRFNIVFAFIFIVIIYYNTFLLSKKTRIQSSLCDS